MTSPILLKEPVELRHMRCGGCGSTHGWNVFIRVPKPGDAPRIHRLVCRQCQMYFGVDEESHAIQANKRGNKIIPVNKVVV